MLILSIIYSKYSYITKKRYARRKDQSKINIKKIDEARHYFIIINKIKQNGLMSKKEFL